MVSVIITTYNRAGYLNKCLHSIVNQTYKDIEIFVIDDGSVDNTSEIVKNFQDKRIVYVKNERTGNVSYSRNMGIKMSSRPYVAFCDDDDTWKANKLDVQLKYIKDEKIVCSNGDVIDENDVIIVKQNNNYKEDMCFDLSFILKDNRILTSSMFVSKDIFDKIGLFEEKHASRCEDYEMWIRMATEYKIKYINQALVSYRLHSGNLSRKSYSDAVEVYETNINILLPFIKHFDAEVVKSANYGITFLYKRLIRVSLVKGHFIKCCLFIKKYFENKKALRSKVANV